MTATFESCGPVFHEINADEDQAEPSECHPDPREPVKAQSMNPNSG